MRAKLVRHIVETHKLEIQNIWILETQYDCLDHQTRYSRGAHLQEPGLRAAQPNQVFSSKRHCFFHPKSGKASNLGAEYKEVRRNRFHLNELPKKGRSYWRRPVEVQMDH